MRYLIGFLCVSALGVMSVVGCSDDACSATVCPCTEGGIRAAIAAGGGPYTFACDGPATVVTESEIVIDNDVILDGQGSLTISAGGHRVLSVPEGVTAHLWGVMVTKGFVSAYYGDWGSAQGAGLANEGTLTIDRCLIFDNYIDQGTGVGVWNAGQMTIIDTAVTENDGYHASCAGIYNDSSGTLTLSNSTVALNHAEVDGGGAGGICNDGEMTVINSTVSGNRVTAVGPVSAAGILNGGRISLINSTISVNDADLGDAIAAGGTRDTVPGPHVEITRSLISGGCSRERPGGEEVTWVSDGYNIESRSDTCGFDQQTDQVNVSADDLNLEPLQDNGGPTETHALGAGSVAIDGIAEEDCLDADGLPLTTDQRGEERPVAIVGPEPKCDVGAFELQP